LSKGRGLFCKLFEIIKFLKIRYGGKGFCVWEILWVCRRLILCIFVWTFLKIDVVLMSIVVMVGRISQAILHLVNFNNIFKTIIYDQYSHYSISFLTFQLLFPKRPTSYFENQFVLSSPNKLVNLMNSHYLI
jgi:hypothetical protein